MKAKSCKQSANCHLCKLAVNDAPSMGKFLDITGPADAVIAIVGESPTLFDITRRQVFAGPSGVLLEQLLEATGFSKSEVYYANALLCTYPSDSKPNRTTIEACAVRLRNELRQLPKLRIIVACGKYALASLTGKEKITEELYNITWNEDLHAYIIPSYHPGFVNRNIEAFEDIAWVFTTAKDLIARGSTGRLGIPKFEKKIARNADEAVQFLEYIAKLEHTTQVVIDCESDDTNWQKTPMLAIGFCLDNVSVYIIPWIYLNNPPAHSAVEDFYVTPEMTAALALVAQNKNLRFTYHNGAFDIKLIWQNTGIHFDIHDDTMLLHYAADERGGGDVDNASNAKIGSHRLKVIARKYLFAPEWEGDIKQYLSTKKTKYSNIPRPRLWTYLAYDLVYTGSLIPKLKQVIEDENPALAGIPSPYNMYEEILIPMQREVIFIEFDGVQINEKTRRKLSTDMRKEINDLYTAMVLEIRKLEGREGPPPPKVTKLGKIAKNQPMEFNPRSPTHLKKLIYTTLKVVITRELRTDERGKVSKTAYPTGKGLLLKIRDKHPIIEMLLNYKIVNKRYGTYVKPLPVLMDSRGHIHTQILISSTLTGRGSSKNPNLQNLTKAIKKLYAPDEDNSPEVTSVDAN